MVFVRYESFFYVFCDFIPMSNTHSLMYYNHLFNYFDYRNILLTKENNSKLADFGVSKIFNQDNSLTSHVGTEPYMSPEIRTGNNYDFKTDIWYV